MILLRKYKYSSLVFAFIFIVNMVTLVWLTQYHVVAKPMIMASLIGCYISNAKKQSHLFLLSLIAAMMGDIFLLFPGDDFFRIGLIAFLCMQLLYILSFKQDVQLTTPKWAGRAAPVLLIATCFMIYAWDYLGPWKLAVSIYCLAITAMVSMSLLRNPDRPESLAIAIGSWLFMVSDLALAFNKFVSTVPYASFIILSTYMAAQFLIVIGVTERHNTDTSRQNE